MLPVVIRLAPERLPNASQNAALSNSPSTIRTSALLPLAKHHIVHRRRRRPNHSRTTLPMLRHIIIHRVCVLRVYGRQGESRLGLDHPFACGERMARHRCGALSSGIARCSSQSAGGRRVLSRMADGIRYPEKHQRVDRHVGTAAAQAYPAELLAVHDGKYSNVDLRTLTLAQSLSAARRRTVEVVSAAPAATRVRKATLRIRGFDNRLRNRGHRNMLVRKMLI